MYELLYSSIANENFSEEELNTLSNEAKVFNQKQDLTGMLVYGHHQFIQILEGEEETVKNLYQKIEKDKRHSSPRIFYEGPIKARAFKHWAMALKVFNSNDQELLEEIGLTSTDGVINQEIILSNPNIGKNLFLCMKEQL